MFHYLAVGSRCMHINFANNIWISKHRSNKKRENKTKAPPNSDLYPLLLRNVYSLKIDKRHPYLPTPRPIPVILTPRRCCLCIIEV